MFWITYQLGFLVKPQITVNFFQILSILSESKLWIYFKLHKFYDLHFTSYKSGGSEIRKKRMYRRNDWKYGEIGLKKKSTTSLCRIIIWVTKFIKTDCVRHFSFHFSLSLSLKMTNGTKQTIQSVFRPKQMSFLTSISSQLLLFIESNRIFPVPFFLHVNKKKKRCAEIEWYPQTNLHKFINLVGSLCSWVLVMIFDVNVYRLRFIDTAFTSISRGITLNTKHLFHLKPKQKWFCSEIASGGAWEFSLQKKITYGIFQSTNLF